MNRCDSQWGLWITEHHEELPNGGEPLSGDVGRLMIWRAAYQQGFSDATERAATRAKEIMEETIFWPGDEMVSAIRALKLGDTK